MRIVEFQSGMLGHMGRDHAVGKLEIDRVVAASPLGEARPLHQKDVRHEAGLVQIDGGALVLLVRSIQNAVRQVGTGPDPIEMPIAAEDEFRIAEQIVDDRNRIDTDEADGFATGTVVAAGSDD